MKRGTGFSAIDAAFAASILGSMLAQGAVLCAAVALIAATPASAAGPANGGIRAGWITGVLADDADGGTPDGGGADGGSTSDSGGIDMTGAGT